MKTLLIALGGLMVVAGVLWTGQGLGWFGGSPMTGSTVWAIVGPITAGLGVALVWVAATGAKRR